MDIEIPITILHPAFWKRLFTEWQCVLKSYIDNVEGDLPYWHRERANTGFLAAACWKIGAVVVEEYWTKRKGKRGTYNKTGSCDLFVKYQRYRIFAEAKQLWPVLLEDKRNIKKIKDSLKYAYEQLKNNRYAKTVQYWVSICYVSPMLAENKKFDKKSYISKLKQGFRKDKYYKDVIIVPFFPDINVERFNGGDKYKYPGVVLIAKIYNM